MIHTKRVIFMILPLLFVPLVYGISSTPDACAVAPDSGWSEGSCAGKTTDPRTGVQQQTCCWTEEERVPGKLPPGREVRYCQTCILGAPGDIPVCDPKQVQSMTPPTTDENIIPGDTGVLEQPEQPLFGGQNDAGVPPTGGIEQPPTATTQPSPGGGGNVPTEGGSAEQPPQTVAPQDNQGGGLPTIKNEENVPPGSGVEEQPQDDGQDDSSEGAETAGPLT
jgi:hypothetical protein